MSIGQFLTIFWARRLLIFWATVSCLVGALIICAIVPPRWESTARVMLAYIKPDPVTGSVVAGNATRFYVQTQESLVTDYTVAGRVAEQVGWLTAPPLISAYQRRSASDQRDFRHFLADIIIGNTKVDVIDGTNIMEIKYTANSSTDAQQVADALRRSYIEASLELDHEDAETNVIWYTEQMNKAKQALDAAEAAEATYEKANGLVMQDNKMDVETAHLQALTMQGAPPYAANPPNQEASASSMQLADVEAQLASASKLLGPNNPEIQQLITKRDALKTLVAQDKANAQASAARADAGGARALASAVQAQQSRVIARSEQIARLNQLHQDVELRRDEYNRMAEKVSHFREVAASREAGITSLGNALTPQSATFPNYLLIVPGAIVLGLGVGVLISLLMELLGRRVRSAADLNFDDEVPLICVVPGVDGLSGRRAPGGPFWRMPWSVNRGAVGA